LRTSMRICREDSLFERALFFHQPESQRLALNPCPVQEPETLTRVLHFDSSGHQPILHNLTSSFFQNASAIEQKTPRKVLLSRGLTTYFADARKLVLFLFCCLFLCSHVVSSLEFKNLELQLSRNLQSHPVHCTEHDLATRYWALLTPLSI
jgi:hypothetical protein